jgi:uncharacterized protein
VPDGDIAIEGLPVEHNADASRFEIRFGDELARVQYVTRGSTLVFTHTEVPVALEGHGIAGRLARHGLEYARANGLSVVPQCPYVRHFIEQHPEYADLVTGE